MRKFVVWVLLGGWMAISGCAHTTNEVQCGPGTARSCGYSSLDGYRFDPGKAQRLRPSDPERRTLVVLTFSGGGVRAAALAYGTLLALRDLAGPNGGASLLDEVDIISSVSGGSVTAGWYAVKGKAAGLSDDENKNDLLRFLRTGGTAELAWRGLNPVTLASYVLTPYQRSDVLADFFADRLFGDTTYSQVEKLYRSDPTQPFVVLNATDLGRATRFPFTQNRFDLICSDLSRYKVADAVAASANFPIVFSPIGLRNFSNECPARGKLWDEAGPPRWIGGYTNRYDAAEPAGTGAAAPRSNGLLALRAAREARGYVTPENNLRFIHLLDGGLTDNLGIQSTLQLEDDSSCAPGLFQRLGRPRPDAYRRIENVLFVVVNARTRLPSGIDDREYPPGPLSSLYRVIDTSIDSNILSVQNYLTSQLQAIAARPPFRPAGNQNSVKTCWQGSDARSQEMPSGNTADKGAPPSDDTDDQKPFSAKIVSIDFEMIPNARCREKFWRLGTNWSLERSTIDELISLPKAILARSAELREFYREMFVTGQTGIEKFPKDFGAVCD
jgi:NTE family protein